MEQNRSGKGRHHASPWGRQRRGFDDAFSEKKFLVTWHSIRLKEPSQLLLTNLNKPQYCSCPLAAASMKRSTEQCYSKTKTYEMKNKNKALISVSWTYNRPVYHVWTND